MRVKFLPLILIALILLLSSCSSDGISSCISDYTSNEELEKYLYINLPQLQKERQRIYYVEWGQLTKTSRNDTVYIFSEMQHAEDIQTQIYMVAEVNGQLLIQELGNSDKMVIQNGNVFLADMDGDAIDEIILHFEISGNGGTITQIYKVENDSIVLFADLNQFDTGFQSLYEPGYKMRIFNRFTQSVYFVDIATWFSEDAFDEKGVALVKENIEVRPFYSCKAKYSDTSGKFELHCMQEVRLGGHIGDVYTVIEYNEMDKMFEVIKSDFLRG